MLALMRMIMRCELSPAITAALLMGLRVKKETIGEISAAAQLMREFANHVEVDGGALFVDIVGTGGDGWHRLIFKRNKSRVVLMKSDWASCLPRITILQ